MTRAKREAITVFGAGISGLTAAHELAERGYRVQVIDSAIGADDPLSMGGMARSQWSWFPITDARSPRMARTRDGLPPVFSERIRYREDPPTMPIDAREEREVLRRLKRFLADHPDVSITIDASAPPDAARLRAARVAQLLVGELGVDKGRIAGVSTNAAGEGVGFVVPCHRFPGEHGFRFFPAFYRNLFDTMRRTPIIERLAHERGRTVLDNLGANYGLEFGVVPPARSFVVPRRRPSSIAEVAALTGRLLADMGYTATDIARAHLKFLQFVTSCRERRESEHEHVSWWQFLDGDRYSAASRSRLESAPQMIAALRGSQSDMRTQGDITYQLMLDQYTTHEHTDSSLNAPTSIAWFRHWHHYLRAELDVEFTRGRLTGFAVRDQGVHPVVRHGSQPVPVIGDRFVLALSLPAMAELAPLFKRAAIKAGAWDTLAPDNDFQRIIDFAPPDLNAELAKPIPDGPLQHLSGIQYYFSPGTRVMAGHTQYLDSPWGLTSQPQYWDGSDGGFDAGWSVVSVDIGTWDQPYKGRIAWNCTADQIARYAWEQIWQAHAAEFSRKHGRGARTPRPLFYHLDNNIELDPAGFPCGDKSPFLVNRTGAYRRRPGRVRIRDEEPKSCYSCHLGRWVIAGTFMQTYTRVTSMEAANESARHAVNALLAETRHRGLPCRIWDPEEHEPDELTPWKEVDLQLVRRGLPHLVDILQLSELPAALLPGSGVP
jgi:hypothetical protein